MLNASSAEENAEENFKHISDLDYSKVDSYFVSYSEEGLADEIAVIAVKDPQDVKEAKESLDDHRDAVQHMSAIKVKADCIVTRNKKDFRKSIIPVYTIDEFMSLMRG